ncbi:MAG: mitofilin family membrane protein [Alphaproteobacteria bacterium]
MSTASETAGPPQGEPDTTRTSSRTAANGRARAASGKGAAKPAAKAAARSATKRSAKTAAKPGSGKAAASRKTTGDKPATKKTAANQPSAAPASPSEPGSPEKERPPKDAETGPPKDETGGELPRGGNGGDGSGPPSGGSGGGLGGGIGGVPWPRLAIYGGAGLAGGLIVAVILLLAEGGGVREQVETLQTRIENMELAQGDPEQVAAMRRRVDELAGRIEALADLSASEPLVQQLSDINATVTKLQGELEELEERAGGNGPVVRVRRKELRANLEQIGEELVRLDTKLSKLAGDVTRTRARLTGRLESLEAATPEDLPGMLDQWSNRVEELKGRIAQLERDEMTRDVRRASLALALAHLTRAVQTSQPFVNELKAIEVLDPDNRLVAELKPYAETGLPSVPMLATRFDKVADDVVRVWRREHGRGFFEWLWDGIVGLFSVRPVGEVEGEKAPAIVARAEQRLEEGELQRAVQTLEKLAQPEREAAQEWLEAARARVRLDNLVAEVNRTVLEEIAEAEAERKAREAGFVPPEAEAPAPAEAAPQPAGPQPAEPRQEEPPAADDEQGAGETAPEPAPEPEPEGGPSPSENEADGASER